MFIVILVIKPMPREKAHYVSASREGKVSLTGNLQRFRNNFPAGIYAYA